MAGEVLTESASPAARGGFHALRVADVDRLCDDAVAVTFDVPAELRRRLRVPARAVPDAAPGPRRAGGAPLVLDLRAGRGAAPDRGAPGGHRAVLRVAGRPAAARRRGRGGAARPARSPRSSTAWHPPRAGRGRLRASPRCCPSRPRVLAAHPDTRVTLLYGNRRTDTVMFAEELADLKNAYGPRLHLVHVLSREPTEAEIFSGRLDADKLRILLGALVDVADVDHWWLCGPLGMTEAAVEVLDRARRGPQAGAPRAVLRRRAAAGAAPPGRRGRGRRAARSPWCSTGGRPR